MAAQAKTWSTRCGMRWAGALTRWPWRAGWALVVMFAPAAAGASTAERIFAAVSPSVVVVRAANSQGSGVVVAPQVVATNCHLLGGPAQTTVQHGRSSHTATRLWGDQQRDLCLLQVPTLEAPPVTLGEAGQLRVGATVYAIGAPQGLELSLSAGLVSQLRAAKGAPLVQTTAPISPGSSGGGLFDERGRLVGLTTFQIEGGQNVNFALPAEWVAAALARASSWPRCRTAPTIACLLAEAREIAGELSSTDDAHRVHIAIADAQAQAGDQQGAAQSFAQALAAALSIEYAPLRDMALADIAAAQARTGDIAVALATALSIEYAPLRAMALADIADAQAQAGDITGALATARGIADVWKLASALSAIARVQAQAGDRQGAAQTVAQALATARSIQDASPRVWALAGIAQAQAEAGDRQGAAQTFTQALATARSIGNAFLRASDLAAIARAQAQAGDIPGALATARSIEIASDRAWALANIGKAQARAGDRQGAEQTLTEALATGRGIANASSRALVLRNIAQAQAEAGDRQGAAQTFAEALTIARTVEDTRERASALRDIAQAQARAGDIAGAVATIDEISNQGMRAWALATVAGHLAQRR